MYAVSRSALARSNVGMKCSPRAVTLKPPRAHPRMTSLSNALIFNPRASYSIVRNVLPIMSSLQKMSLQQKSFQVGASRRMAAIGLWSQIRLCSSGASSKYASEQPRQHKKEESPEDEFDKLWETDPVATLPPELYGRREKIILILIRRVA